MALSAAPAPAPTTPRPVLSLDDPDVYVKAKEAVDIIATNYARKHPGLSRADLIQQGWLLTAKILRTGTFDPTVGVSLTGFLRAILGRQMFCYVRRQNSVVSSSKHTVRALAATYKYPYDTIQEWVLDRSSPGQEAEYRRNKIARLLRGLVSRRVLRLGVPVVLKDRTYKACAELENATEADVKDAARTLRRAVSGNMDLWRLWTLN